MKNTLIKIYEKLSARFRRGSIRYAVFISFTLSALAVVGMTIGIFYLRYSNQLDSAIYGENQILIDQVGQNLSTYLRNMIKLSDSLYYNVIKGSDLDEDAIKDELQLLYTANSTYVENIMLFDSSGNALAAAPAAVIKPGADVRSADWFQSAMRQSENLHFSIPAVQNLIVDLDHQYKWVVSLSCAVEITRGKNTEQGVLLIDLKYSGVSDVLQNYSLANDGYIYLTDASGNIIFHPQMQQIASGYAQENNTEAAGHKDGTFTDTLNGEKRSVFVRTVGYTGWKVVGVIPQKGITLDRSTNLLFILLIFFALAEFIVLINAIISAKLTDPIKKLDMSVQEIERGRDGMIFDGGSYEIKHLGQSITRMVGQMRRLTDEMVREHELKQKSELNALQAQINPHFLYNTLDIIVWMIENERADNAVQLVTALARLFRISLSKGRTIIPVRDELEHVRNYLMIQQMRYKNKFRYEINADDALLDMSIIKLVLQPIVENAIYHSMDFMDGDGLITVEVKRAEDGMMTLSVNDNGTGMSEETVRRILTDQAPVSGSSKGAGIGLRNVNERIKLYFGDDYGVSIESELDVGTRITLTLPAIPYGEMEEKE